MLETLSFVSLQLFSQMPYITSEVDIQEENKLDSKIMKTEKSSILGSILGRYLKNDEKCSKQIHIRLEPYKIERIGS